MCASVFSVYVSMCVSVCVSMFVSVCVSMCVSVYVSVSEMPVENEDRVEEADKKTVCPKSDNPNRFLGSGASRCLRCKKSQNQLVRCGKSW